MHNTYTKHCSDMLICICGCLRVFNYLVLITLMKAVILKRVNQGAAFGSLTEYFSAF